MICLKFRRVYITSRDALPSVLYTLLNTLDTRAEILFGGIAGVGKYWYLCVPLYNANLLEVLKHHGDIIKGEDIPQRKSRFWIRRPVTVIDNQFAHIGGNVISSWWMLPLEHLLSSYSEFHVRIALCQKKRAPNSDVDVMLPVVVSTDNADIANTLAEWLGGRVYSEKRHTFIYRRERPFFIRPPLASLDQPFWVKLDKSSEGLDGVVSNIVANASRHILILGQTGAGKTNTARILLDELVPKVSGLLLLDVQGEYEDWAKSNEIEYLPVGLSPKSLSRLMINPFIPPRMLRLASYLDILALSFSIGPTGGASPLLPAYMKGVLRTFYGSRGLGEFLHSPGEETQNFLRKHGKTLALKNLWLFWEQQSERILERILGSANGRGAKETYNVLHTRLLHLKESIFQFFEFGKHAQAMDILLNRRIVLSLQGLSDAEVDLLMTLFTGVLVEVSLALPKQEDIKYIMAIEEAHRVMQKQYQGGGILRTRTEIARYFQRGLRQLRSKGVGLIVLDQSPHLLINDVFNSGTIIVHRMTLADDLEVLEKSLGVSSDEIRNLDIGASLVHSVGMPLRRVHFPLWKKVGK